MVAGLRSNLHILFFKVHFSSSARQDLDWRSIFDHDSGVTCCVIWPSHIVIQLWHRLNDATCSFFVWLKITVTLKSNKFHGMPQSTYRVWHVCSFDRPTDCARSQRRQLIWSMMSVYLWLRIDIVPVGVVITAGSWLGLCLLSRDRYNCSFNMIQHSWGILISTYATFSL